VVMATVCGALRDEKQLLKGYRERTGLLRC